METKRVFRRHHHGIVALLALAVTLWNPASARCDDSNNSNSGHGNSGSGSSSHGNSSHGSSGHGNSGSGSSSHDDSGPGNSGSAGSGSSSSGNSGSSNSGSGGSASGSQSSGASSSGPAETASQDLFSGARTFGDLIRTAKNTLAQRRPSPEFTSQLNHLDELERLMGDRPLDPDTGADFTLALAQSQSDPGVMRNFTKKILLTAAAPRSAPVQTRFLAGQRPGRGTSGAASSAGGIATAPAKSVPGDLKNASAVVDLIMPAKTSGKPKIDAKEALVKATQRLSENPKDFQAIADRAEALNELGDYMRAEREATRALLLEPRLIRALNARAYAYNKRGQYSLAMLDAEVVLGQEPDNAMGHLNKAMALEGQGQVREALLEYETAAGLDPALNPFYLEAVARHGGGSSPAAASASVQPAPASQTLSLRDLSLVGFGIMAALFLGIAVSRRGAGPARPEDPPASPEPDGVIAGSYRLERQIGQGGMGVVFEGTDLTLQRKVAIKKMRSDIRQGLGEEEMFISEARLVAALKHPSLVEIYAVLQEKGDVYLVFEHLAGRPLDKILSAKGRLAPPEALHILDQVAQGIDYAHSKKVIHRDLKPGNIMITNEGAVKIMDFGIAHRARVSATRFTTAAPCGTVFYMPPEQEMGTVILESDIYALGVVAYEMLTGEVPFHGPNFLEQKQTETYTKASLKLPNLPTAMDPVLARALSATSGRRYHSAAEFISELGASFTLTPHGVNGSGRAVLSI